MLGLCHVVYVYVLWIVVCSFVLFLLVIVLSDLFLLVIVLSDLFLLVIVLSDLFLLVIVLSDIFRFMADFGPTTLVSSNSSLVLFVSFGGRYSNYVFLNFFNMFLFFHGNPCGFNLQWCSHCLSSPCYCYNTSHLKAWLVCTFSVSNVEIILLLKGLGGIYARSIEISIEKDVIYGGLFSLFSNVRLSLVCVTDWQSPKPQKCKSIMLLRERCYNNSTD